MSYFDLSKFNEFSNKRSAGQKPDPEVLRKITERLTVDNPKMIFGLYSVRSGMVPWSDIAVLGDSVYPIIDENEAFIGLESALANQNQFKSQFVLKKFPELTSGLLFDAYKAKKNIKGYFKTTKAFNEFIQEQTDSAKKSKQERSDNDEEEGEDNDDDDEERNEEDEDEEVEETEVSEKITSDDKKGKKVDVVKKTNKKNFISPPPFAVIKNFTQFVENEKWKPKRVLKAKDILKSGPSDLGKYLVENNMVVKLEIDSIFLKFRDGFKMDIGIMKVFAYTGLDMVLIASIVFKIQDRRGRDPTEDFKTFAMYYLTRGSTLSEKAIMATSEKGKHILRELQWVYGLVKNINQVSAEHRATALTIPRIIAIIPHIIAKTIAMDPMNSYLKITGDSNISGLPKYLRFPAAAALIPQENDTLISQFKAWSLEFSNIIRNKDKSWKDMPLEKKNEEIDRYFNASHRSPLIPMDQRAKILADCKSLHDDAMLRYLERQSAAKKDSNSNVNS